MKSLRFKISPDDVEQLKQGLLESLNSTSFLRICDDFFIQRYAQVFHEDYPSYRKFLNRSSVWDRYMLTPIEFLMNFLPKETFKIYRFRRNGTCWLGRVMDESDKEPSPVSNPIDLPDMPTLQKIINQTIGSEIQVPKIDLHDLWSMLQLKYEKFGSERLFQMTMRNGETPDAKVAENVWVRNIYLARAQLVSNIENLFVDYGFIPIESLEKCYLQLYREAPEWTCLMEQENEFSSLGEWLKSYCEKTKYSEFEIFKLKSHQFIKSVKLFDEWKREKMMRIQLNEASELKTFVYEMECLIPYNIQVAWNDYCKLNDNVYGRIKYSVLDSVDFFGLVKQMENKFKRQRPQFIPERSRFLLERKGLDHIVLVQDCPLEAIPDDSELESTMLVGPQQVQSTTDFHYEARAVVKVELSAEEEISLKLRKLREIAEKCNDNPASVSSKPQSRSKEHRGYSHIDSYSCLNSSDTSAGFQGSVKSENYGSHGPHSKETSSFFEDKNPSFSSNSASNHIEPRNRYSKYSREYYRQDHNDSPTKAASSVAPTETSHIKNTRDDSFPTQSRDAAATRDSILAQMKLLCLETTVEQSSFPTADEDPVLGSELKLAAEILSLVQSPLLNSKPDPFQPQLFSTDILSLAFASL